MVALLLALAACSGPRSGAPLLAEAPPAREQDTVAIETLVSANVIGIMRTRPDLFMPLRFLGPLLASPPPACWTDLANALVATYQLSVPRAEGGNTAYWILEGKLPKSTVASCVPAAITQTSVTVQADGDLLAFSGPDGATTYAAWRGPYVVIGARDLVNDAQSAAPEVQARWRELSLSADRSAPIWFGSMDALLGNLFGVPTVRYQLVFERLETAPSVFFSGRAVISYATPGDAAIAARRARQGELQLPFEAPELNDSFQRMKVIQTGASVEIRFDLGVFGGVDANTLLRYAGTLLAAQQQR